MTCLLGERCVVETKYVATTFLRLIHGRGGIFEQRDAVISVIRIEADAYACPYKQDLPVQSERLRHRIEDPGRCCGSGGGIGVSAQHDKLVAAQASYGI